MNHIPTRTGLDELPPGCAVECILLDSRGAVATRVAPGRRKAWVIVARRIAP